MPANRTLPKPGRAQKDSRTRSAPMKNAFPVGASLLANRTLPKPRHKAKP